MKTIAIKQVASKVWTCTKQVFRILRKIYLWTSLLWLILLLAGAVWLYREFMVEPKVEPGTVLVMNLDGVILDGPSTTPLIHRVLGEYAQTQQDVVNNIRKATHDPRIIGLYIKLDNYAMLYETAVEIRDELLKFKEAGKKIFAYAEYSGRYGYFLTSVADKIYLVPPGDIYLRGWRAEVPFYRDVLDKVGITPEFIYIGKYKTAPQIFTMNHMSDAYRDVINDLLDAQYANYVEQISTTRNVAPEEVKVWIDAGLYSAAEALERGIVDELLYEDAVEKRIMVELGLTEPENDATGSNEPDMSEETDASDMSDLEEEPKLKTINMSQYTRVKVDAPWLHKHGEKIAVYYVQGSIVSGEGPSSPYSQVIASETVSQQLEELAEKDDIKGIILRVDSGGGSATASSVIWNAMSQAKKKKPVVVSMVGAAASGGYFISAPADSIVAYPSTITGSIGVFGGKFSMKGLWDWIGVHIESIQRGENAGMFTDSRTWTESEKARFRHFIQEFYDDFVQKVANGRSMTFAAVDEIAQGRVWTGEQASELGLVDELGGLETAIAILKEKIGIPEEDDVCLVQYPKMDNPVKMVLDHIRETRTDSQLPEELREVQQQLDVLKRLENERFFAWFPVPRLVE